MRVKIFKNVRKAKELGAAFKKGYPKTYTKSQTKPIFRKSPYHQKLELERLVYTTGMSWGAAYVTLKAKYENAGHKWHPKMKKNG